MKALSLLSFLKIDKMIKTYRYNELCNNVSITLSGDSGNSMRYNFTHGNTFTRKCPEKTLRNKYAQDLLESHELFKSGKVSLISSVAESSDVIDEEPTPATKKESKTEEVKGIRTTDEVIAYVNERFNKDCRNLSTAMKHASKAGLVFPDYNNE